MADPSPRLRIGLWVAQVVLALTFLAVSVYNLLTPYEEIARQFVWARSMPAPLVKFIGVAEAAGAIGVVVPAATRVLPWLTPLAAAGLGFVMVLASGVHLAHSEYRSLPITLGLLGLSFFVGWGRYKRLPIAP